MRFVRGLGFYREREGAFHPPPPCMDPVSGFRSLIGDTNAPFPPPPPPSFFDMLLAQRVGCDVIVK